MTTRLQIGHRREPVMAGDDLEIRIVLEDQDGAPIDPTSIGITAAKLAIMEGSTERAAVTLASGGITLDGDADAIVARFTQRATEGLAGVYSYELEIVTPTYGVVTVIAGEIHIHPSRVAAT